MTKSSIRLDQFQNDQFDRGAPRSLEVLWLICQSLFFGPLVPWPSALRAALLRAFGAKIGEGLVIRSGVQMKFPWRFRCGDHVWIGESVRLLNLEVIELGDHVCLSQESFFCTGSHRFGTPGFDLITRPIVVGNHSWVGARAFVGPGVEIGRDCFVTAGSVLSSDLPDSHRARGNPAIAAPLEEKNS